MRRSQPLFLRRPLRYPCGVPSLPPPAPPLLAATPAPVQFEKAEISEEELLRIFFADGRPVDGAALRQHMVSACVRACVHARVHACGLYHWAVHSADWPVSQPPAAPLSSWARSWAVLRGCGPAGAAHQSSSLQQLAFIHIRMPPPHWMNVHTSTYPRTAEAPAPCPFRWPTATGTSMARSPCLPPLHHAALHSPHGGTPPGPARLQADSYRYLDGMEPLLQRLAASGTQVSAAPGCGVALASAFWLGLAGARPCRQQRIACKPARWPAEPA